MKLKALLFDLDGTLVDTAPDMVGSLNRVLEKHSKPLVDYDAASKIVSNGGKALIEYGFGEAIKNYNVDFLVTQFLQDYEQHVADQSQLYDGMESILEWCEAHQIAWGVITNKPLHLAKSLIEKLDLLERCKILLGGDSLPVKKPDPVPMLHACMILDLAPSDCLYVGDHERDMQAANTAGMDSAVALWGYIDEQQTPAAWHAKYMCRSVSGLFDLVQERHSS